MSAPQAVDGLVLWFSLPCSNSIFAPHHCHYGCSSFPFQLSVDKTPAKFSLKLILNPFCTLLHPYTHTDPSFAVKNRETYFVCSMSRSNMSHLESRSFPRTCSELWNCLWLQCNMLIYVTTVTTVEEETCQLMHPSQSITSEVTE